jgi:hypothetical protein
MPAIMWNSCIFHIVKGLGSDGCSSGRKLYYVGRFYGLPNIFTAYLGTP